MSQLRHADHDLRIARSGSASRPARVARALGVAVAPRTETRVLARGTHRTRVSEMRSAAARSAAARPEGLDARQWAGHATVEREEGGQVRQSTG